MFLFGSGVQSKVRQANIFWSIMMIAPLWWLLVAIQIGSTIAGSDLSFIVPLVLIVTIGDIAIISFFQISKRARASVEKRRGPSEAIIAVFRISCLLSESLSICGLVLSMLSGGPIYVEGYSVVAWVLLVWLRVRLSSSVASIEGSRSPSSQPTLPNVGWGASKSFP